MNLIFMMVTISILMIISSSSWFHIWLSMEINMVSFIGMILHNKNMHEPTIKYFLIQAMGSSLFIISSALYNFNFIQFNDQLMMGPSMALLIKLGMVPFHFWYPEVMNLMSWNNCMILSTFQKLGPLTILFNMKISLMMFSLMSVIIGSLSSVNQTSLRKLMSFSSISHNGWMLSAISVHVFQWYMYFILYTIMTLMIMSFMNNFKWYHINQIDLQKYSHTMNLMVALLSLGGMPPTIGFLPKWFILNIMMNYSIIISIILVMSSLLMLFAYLMLLYKPLFLMKNKHPLQNHRMYKWEMSTLLMTIPTIPLFFM